MAQGKITAKCAECGKEFEKVSQHGLKGREAEQWESWAEGQDWLCYSCYEAQKEAERQARKEAEAKQRAEMVADFEAKSGKPLPTLVGSEKQISWAESIRLKVLTAHYRRYTRATNYLERLKNISEDALAKLYAEHGKEKIDKGRINDIAIIQKALKEIEDCMACTDAHWWIDNRDNIDVCNYLERI